jgi:hypothetical protein
MNSGAVETQCNERIVWMNGITNGQTDMRHEVLEVSQADRDELIVL